MASRWLSIRIDDEVRERAKAAAAADRRSMSTWIVLLIEKALAAEATQPPGRGN